MHTPHTIEGGVDKIMTHTTVLRMDWVTKWFLQPTWDGIHERGLEEARPQIGAAPVLLLHEAAGQNNKSEWMLEKYDHVELARHGGFQTSDDEEIEFLYGRIGEVTDDRADSGADSDAYEVA